jgi:superfamily I DNA/RNA helicase/Zn-dependent peptidase ImmA (M78 family)
LTPFHRARVTADQVRKDLFASDAVTAIPSKTIIDAFADENAEDFDVSSANPTDTALGGADAVLLRKLRQVVVRNDVSTAERAFLVAHEFGHWKLHAEGHDGCHQVIEATLNPQESDTFGAQKVEAYGARERAELQANIFARELLLPRTVARSLFCAGQTAVQMARELDLPLELVRQQLLDALLLPEPSLIDEAPEEPIIATPEQLAAATSSANVSLVVAGPGTGKTATLLMRVQHLIAQGVKPTELLLLTFSNRAAREMVDRLEQLGVQDAHQIWVGTFHAFGLEFLRKNYQHFRLQPRFGVADKMAQIAVLEPHIYGLGLTSFNPLGDPLDWLNEVVGTIQRAKDELADVDRFAAAVEDSASEADEEVLAKQRDVVKLYRCYETQMKAKGNLVDLGDLVMAPALALGIDYTKYESSVGRFKHILVDEYQDVNRASAQLVAALAAHADTLWVVGDARQAIYRFRGASMRNIVHFEADFPGHEAFLLNENRRSFEEVVRVFEHTGREAHPLQLLLPLDDVEPKRGASGFKPRHIECADNTIVHGELAENVRRIHKLGGTYRDQVVLASTHDTCGAAADALNHAGIPALHLGDIFQHPEVKDLLTLLQLFVDRSGSGLVRAAHLPSLEIPSADVEVLLSELQENRPTPLSWVGNPPAGLSARGMDALKQWASVFRGLSSTDSPWDVICALLLDRTDILRRSLSGTSVLDVTRRIALWQFIYYLRVPEGGHTYQTVGSFLTRLRRRLRVGDDRELRIPPPEADSVDAVAVMTIHGSKGLEFEAVHLVDIDAKHFSTYGGASELLPGSLQNQILPQGDCEAKTEASNKLYVALSRAKQHLVLYERQDGTKAVCAPGIVKAGHLLQKVRGCAVVRQPLAKQTLTASDTITAPVDFSAFLSYRVCPRRYYYDYVLNLSPASGMPPAVAIEGAVMRELFVSHGETPGESPGEVDRVLSSLRADYADAVPYLQAYANQLLVTGRHWLGAQRAAIAKPFDVTCAGLPLRISPHRITRNDNVRTIEFVRTRPAGKLGRQRATLRWMLKHLASTYRQYSFTASIFVLSTGVTDTFYPDGRSFTNHRVAAAANGLMAGDVTAAPNQWECPKCRHFLYCPA